MSQSTKSSFSNVDASTNPDHFVRSLNQQISSGLQAERKQRILAHLDLQAGHHVLDVGCGTGLDAIEMAHNVGKTGNVIGIDFSQKMVAVSAETAQQTDLPLRFQQADAHDLPFDNNQFDRVRADRTFQHLADPKAALAELVRVTKPNGKLVIGDPDHDSVVIDTPYPDITARFLRFRSQSLASGGAAHQLYRLMSELGLRNIAVEPITTVYTDYASKITSPYIQEIWVAHEYGIVTKEEADRWGAYLEAAVSAETFLCMETFIITSAIKP